MRCTRRDGSPIRAAVPPRLPAAAWLSRPRGLRRSAGCVDSIRREIIDDCAWRGGGHHKSVGRVWLGRGRAPAASASTARGGRFWDMIRALRLRAARLFGAALVAMSRLNGVIFVCRPCAAVGSTSGMGRRG